jgi:hypothetical protein
MAVHIQKQIAGTTALCGASLAGEEYMMLHDYTRDWHQTGDPRFCAACRMRADQVEVETVRTKTISVSGAGFRRN